MVEQKINTRKIDEGYYVEVLNDGELVWTDTFETEEELNRFIEYCDGNKPISVPLSQEEGRKALESGESRVEVFYRHPMGYRFAIIYNHGAFHEPPKHGFEVFFHGRGDDGERWIFPTLDEAFQFIKDVEDGKILKGAFKPVVEQKISTRKTDEGYYVEVLNDGKLVWTYTYETEEGLNRFLKACDSQVKRDNCPYLSQEEGRRLLERGVSCVNIFYRHPLGYMSTWIYNLDAFPVPREHGFSVWFCNKDDYLDSRTVSTIDEAFQLIKDVEDGKV